MSSVFDDLLKSIESDLNLARRDLGQRLDPIRAAIDSYERAVLEKRALDYCQAHSLRRPKTAGILPQAAAQGLLHLVRSLPELAPTAGSQAGESKEATVGSSSATDDPTPAGSDDGAAMPVDVEPESAPGPVDEVTARFAARFPALTQASASGRLLVFGAFSGRTKTLPGPLADVTDWIDTASDGNRVVSAAVRRITTGAVFAVIICDQAIAHQHADPATRAARNHKLPIAYAGKGGNASLARALEALEEALSGASKL